ncbi:MAG: tetratricopeptide repeat protein [Lewinellaceae bacterium]|nr:tetratricopeptide repeat protein [Lewinellaceae bacterium]
MIYRLYACLLFLNFTVNIVSGQDQKLIDSLLALIPENPDTSYLEAYTDIALEYLYTDHLKAREYVDAYLQIAQKYHSPEHIAFGTNLLGVYYNVVSNYNEGLEIFKEAKTMYEELGNQERVSAILNNMSIANRNMGYLEKALQNQMESLEIKERIGVGEEALAASYWNIGNILGDIKNYEESNAWYRKAEDVYTRLGLEADRLDVRYVLALNLKDMDSLELALPIFEESLDYYRKNNLHNSIAGCLDILGTIHKSRGELEAAEYYYLESLDIALKHGEESLPGLLYRRLANVYREKEQYSRALNFAEKALEVSRKTGVRKKMITDYLVLSQITEDMGDQGRSLQYYKEYHALHDSVFAEEKVLAMNEMEVKYQAEKKEQEIRLLNEKAKRTALVQKGLAGAVAALAALLLALGYAISQRAKRNRLEKEKLDEEIAFKKRELSAFALQLAQKNEVLQNIKEDISVIKNTDASRELNKINRKIGHTLRDNANWELFLERFEAVYQGYQKKVLESYPSVTSNDLRLMALIKMNLSSKEIANLLNLSNEGIKKARYRLRKKLDIETAESLDEFVMGLF